MIRLRGVTVQIGGRPIVQDVDLEVETGSWTCLIGPNGAGKTTLLRAIVGAFPCTGEISIEGDDARARIVAYLPQKPVLPLDMTVHDYVALGRTPHIPYLGAESRHDLEVVARVLANVELEEMAGRALGSLSGGEVQRAILGRALAQEPKALLLDEPTTGMDIGHQQQALELVDEMRRANGLTVLSAIHDLTLAAQFSDLLVLINAGRVAATGPPREILNAELLLAHYGAPVKIIDDPTGPAVVPLRSARREPED